MDVYCYELDGNLYINLTNRCSNDCRFCVRAVNPNYYGNDLWLSKEPTAEEVIAALPDKNYNEVVFCGYGEPTFRIKELVEIGKELKKRGYIVRLNTNGQGNLINGRNIVDELAEGVAKECRKKGLSTNFSIVDCIGEENIALCKKIAEETGVPLKIREFIK